MTDDELIRAQPDGPVKRLLEYQQDMLIAGFDEVARYAGLYEAARRELAEAHHCFEALATTLRDEFIRAQPEMMVRAWMEQAQRDRDDARARAHRLSNRLVECERGRQREVNRLYVEATALREELRQAEARIAGLDLAATQYSESRDFWRQKVRALQEELAAARAALAGREG